MKTYLIIYTSNNTQSIVDRIKTFKYYIRIKYRVWCISTDINSASEVRNIFKDIQEIELLMVIDISQSSWAAINLSPDSVFWLKER